MVTQVFMGQSAMLWDVITTARDDMELNLIDYWSLELP